MIRWHSEMMAMRYDDILIIGQMSEKVANWVGGGWCPSGQKGIKRWDQPFRMSTLSTAPNTDTCRYKYKYSYKYKYTGQRTHRPIISFNCLLLPLKPIFLPHRDAYQSKFYEIISSFVYLFSLILTWCTWIKLFTNIINDWIYWQEICWKLTRGTFLFPW